MDEKIMRAYQPKPVDPRTIEHIHLIGVAGTGMGTLAGMLKQAGYLVSGSDQNIYPPMSDQLKVWKIDTYEGFSAENLEHRPDLVIVGNACRPSNEEVQAAFTKEIACTSMPQAVYDFFLKDREVIAVTGTHGKTTTTSMLAWLLQAANLQPGLLVGGVSLNFNGSYQLPGGRFFVIEGDEYDSALFDKVPKFTHYHPRYAILSSLEFDHADIYPNLKAVKKAFRKLIEILPPDGHLWVCGHYPHALEVAQPSHTPSLTYGLQPTFDLYADNLTWTDQGVNFNLFLKQRSVGRFLLPMFGEFNVLNAIAAIGVALHLDIPVTTIQSALPEFRGVRRRQEIVANIDDILIIDDFAHHPTAIQATTQSIRQRFPQRRIWGIFEPRSNTARRRHFQDQLPLAFDACDRVVLCQPYIDKSLPPDQRLDVHKVIEDIQKRTDSNKLPLVTACPHADAIASFLTAKARPKDIFVIMSNGGFDQLIPKLKAALTLRFQQSPLVFGREED